MTFPQKVYAFARQNRLFDDCTGVVLAVSGGPDSMAMLSVLSSEKGLFDFPICVAHVNHRLREEADEEQTSLKKWCAEHTIPFYTKTVDIRSECPSGVSVETYARQVRYDFLNELRAELGFSHIATAHTADDNIETFFMRLCRGVGSHGLCGIRPLRDGYIARPLLGVYKSEILAYLTEHKIPFATDRTNSEPICTRNVFRNEILPLLLLQNPSLSDAVLHTEASLREEDEYVSACAEQAFRGCQTDGRFSVSAVRALPVALRHRVYALAVPGLSFEKVALLDTLFLSDDPSGRVTIGDGIVALREYDTVFFGTSEAPTSFEPFPLSEGTFDLGSYTLTVTKVSEGAVLPFGEYTVRPREEGDKICLNPKTGTKTVKKYFIEKKIPVRERSSLPVIVCENNVAWVGLLGKSAAIPAVREGFMPVLTKKSDLF